MALEHDKDFVPIRNANNFYTCVGGYANFIKNTEDAYFLTIYEYTDDLTYRDVIQDMLDEGFTPEETVQQQIDALDIRLKAMLRPTLKPIYMDQPPNRFWYFGLPFNISGEILEDAHNHGLIAPTEAAS